MMGLILKESLADSSVLKLVHIIRTETWQVKYAAPYQPSIWNAIYFEIEDSRSDIIAEALSRALKPQAWYINASTETHVFVIFPNKIFKHIKGDSIAREEAVSFALSIGVPASQLDWDE